MQIIHSSISTKKKQRQLQQNLTLALVFGIGGLLILLVSLGGLIPEEVAFVGWLLIPLGAGLLIGGAWFGRLLWIYHCEKDDHGRLIQALSQFLGHDFIYFRDLPLPEARSVGEVDGVLLGPHGALVLQIEPGYGEFACEGDTWYHYYGKYDAACPDKKRRRMAASPTWAVIRVGREVKAWLSVRDLPLIPVRLIVVLTRGKIRFLKRPSCQVIELESIQTFIQDNLIQNSPQLVTTPVADDAVEQIAHRLQN